MIRDDDMQKILKRMIKEVFGLSDEEADAAIQGGIISGGRPVRVEVSKRPEINKDNAPLVEIFDNGDQYSVIIEGTGVTHENVFINVKREGEEINLLYGIQDPSGRFNYYRARLPDDASEIFGRDNRGGIIEVSIKKKTK